MAGPKPNIDYNPIPTVEAGGGGGSSLNVRANPVAFGAATGQAIESAGKTAFDLSTKYAQEATESKANDILANQWSPVATKLRADYDSLSGADKVHGYQNYMNKLRQTREDFISKASSPLEKDILSGYTSRHVIQEEQSASRELAASQKEFSEQSTYDVIKANSDNAKNNYNNPTIVESTIKTNDALITKSYIDKGVDPNSEMGKASIEEAQRTSTGGLAVGMINRASSVGDVNEAYNIRKQFGPTIPGDMQLVVDNTLHYQAIHQTSVSAMMALKNGKPIPNAIGAPPAQVQAVVANTAVARGLDHNDALTVLRIESNDGQNVGERGDIGQTGKGGTLEEQAHNLVIEKKKANDAATKALGRPATAAEGYICYQQGGAGGTVLLKAAAAGSGQRAVDALLPFYKSRKIALEAVVKNGGNATMTCGDFVDFLKNKYDSNSRRAAVNLAGTPALKDYSSLNTKLSPDQEIKFQEWKIKYASNDSGEDYDLRGAFLKGVIPNANNGHFPDEFKKPNHPTFSDQSKFAKDYPELAGHWEGETYIPAQKKSIGDAILEPHIKEGQVVQPAASPMQALLNFDKKSPGMLMQINSIANTELKKGVLEKYNQDRSIYEASAKAYTQGLVNQAMVIAASPTFTSMEQIPPEVYSALALDHPQTIPVLEKRAEANIKRSSVLPMNFADEKTLGPQIAAHVSVAQSSGKLGVPGEIFTKEDAAVLAKNWDGKTVNEKMNFLTDLRNYLPDSQGYQAAMQEIRPDSPVTAIAGEFTRLEGKTEIKGNVFHPDEYVTPDTVARKLLAGEELLNPTKFDRAQDGKQSSAKVFPMPSDEGALGLREEFNAYVGNSLRGMPQLYDQTYQAYKAYYAAEAAESGVYSNELDTDISDKAVKAVMGTIVDQDDLKVIAPWGMDESTFKDKAAESFRNVAVENGYNPNFISINSVQLENTGEPGAYRAVTGAGYIIDKEGKPIVIRI